MTTMFSNGRAYQSLAAAVIRQAAKDLNHFIITRPKGRGMILMPTALCATAEQFFESGDYEGWANIAGVDINAIRRWYWTKGRRPWASAKPSSRVQKVLDEIAIDETLREA